MSQFIEYFGNPVANEKQWKTSPISKVAPESPSEHRLTGEVWLLNLDMIESNTGRVIEKVFESDSNLLSVAPFDEGNVLYSKLRPYLNKVVIPDSKGYATTELIPLRPNQEILNNEFLSYLLRSNEFVSYANSISSGTKMPRMPLADLRKFECILPPMDLQQRFVSFAHQADKSEFDVIKSQFIEMFTNNNFEMVPLGDLCDKISDGSHNPPKGIENSKYLMISSKNVFKDHLDLTDVRYLTEEDFEVENKRTNVKANDVLLTIVGTIGRTYLVKGDEGNLVMQRSVAVLTPNSRVTPLFLMFYLHSDKNLEKEGRGNAQKGIYLKQLSQYEIKVPSIDLQKQFEAIYRQADKSESGCEYRMVS